MKQIRIIFVLLSALLLAGCSNVTELFSPSTATPTLTLTPTKTPTKTPVPTATPRPVITIEPYFNLFPEEWGLQPLSDEQVDEVAACDIEDLAEDRYPEGEEIDELIYLYEPESSCDWAVLAYAYAFRLQDVEEKPDIARNAFAQAISINPGFALSTPLFYSYLYDAFPIVNQPLISGQEITRAKIEYQWGGIGDPVQYTVDITQANTTPSVRVSDYEPQTVTEGINTTIEKQFVQNLSTSLSNLLPINSQFSLMPCYDNNPDWTVTLTFKDGTILIVKTNASNMIFIGGPWQTNIDGQDYIQFSVDFIRTLDTLIQEIGLPYGQPAAMTCGWEDVLEKAYP